MSGIGGIGSNSSMMMHGMRGMKRPDPAEMAENLFSKLDTSGQGFTKDELSSQLEEIGSTDSQRSSLISSVIENFDQADTDGNGKVSFQEAMAYDQSTRTSDAASQSGNSGSAATGSSASGNTSETKVMLQIMKLMQAYNLGGQDQGTSSLLSVTA